MADSSDPDARARATRTLRRLTAAYRASMTTLRRVGIHEDPFRSLVATVISQRSRDAQTDAAAARLFALAATPPAMVALGEGTIERAIALAGFQRQKARKIHALSRALVDRFDGRVPRTVDELVTLPGVGRKTANCVRNFAFGLPAIAVDVHVHRIANRLGWVRTRRPDETERALEALVPRRRWVSLNELLVLHGQTICLPRRPHCASCPVEGDCEKRGVARG